MPGEDLYQSLKVRGVGAQSRWVPIAIEGGSLFSAQAFHN